MNDLSSILNVMNDSVVLTDELRGFVFAVARRIVRDDDDAADVTQDALLLAHRHRDAFRGDSSYRTWLYRIATTTALGHLRRRKRTREQLVLGDEPVGVAEPDPAPSPEDQAATHEVAELVRRAIDGLDDKYRDVLLARADDASESEVAVRLGVTIANVKIRTHRARRQLRDALAA